LDLTLFILMRSVFTKVSFLVTWITIFLQCTIILMVEMFGFFPDRIVVYSWTWVCKIDIRVWHDQISKQIDEHYLTIHYLFSFNNVVYFVRLYFNNLMQINIEVRRDCTTVVVYEHTENRWHFYFLINIPIRFCFSMDNFIFTRWLSSVQFRCNLRQV
jgi:hypothetical protein